LHSDFGVVGAAPMKTYDAEIRVVRNNEGKSPDDFEIYNVHYDDVRDQCT